jgi:hypothetical protein
VPFLVRLLITCGLWFALVGQAHAFRADSGGQKQRSSAASMVAEMPNASSDVASGIAWEQERPSAQVDKARWDLNVVNKLAISLALPKARPTREALADSSTAHIGCLVSKAPRLTANARAPPSTLR